MAIKHPLVEHIIKANKLIQMLKSYPRRILFPVLGDVQSIQINIYCDSSWENLSDGSSAEGYIILLSSQNEKCSPMSWSSNKIHRKVQSTLWSKCDICYEPHGHVITGDLRVIENAKLRELVAKGPKYREPNRVNWKAIETMFLESIDLYAKYWSKREQVKLKYLSEWKDQLKELVADRISNLKGHFKSPKCKVLDQPDVKDTLHKLHANYILVPADKAANNVIIVSRNTILTP